MVALTSAALGTLPDTILVTIDGAFALAARSDDSTFQLALPDTLRSGAHTIAICSHGDRPTVTIQVAGFRRVTDLGFSVSSYPTAWPARAPEGIIAPIDSQLHFVDLGTRAIRPLGLAFRGHFSRPGTSYRPSELVAQTAGGAWDSLILWEIDHVAGNAVWSAGIKQDWSSPAAHYRLSPGVVAYGWGTLDIMIHGWPSGPALGYFPVKTFDTPEFVLSPTGDRAAFTVKIVWAPGGPSGATDEVPVLNALTGQVAFRLAGIKRLDAVAFSEDGASLYGIVATEKEDSNRKLIRYSAALGAPMAEVTLRRDWYHTAQAQIAVATGSGMVFLAERVENDWVVSGYDPMTLMPEVRVRAPGGAAACTDRFGILFPVQLIHSPRDDRLWLLSNHCQGYGSRTVVFEFDLLE